MIERPILFRGPLVLEILADRKTQTRRPIKPQPAIGFRVEWLTSLGGSDRPGFYLVRGGDVVDVIRCPYGVPGDRLWVKETFANGVGPGGKGDWVRRRSTDVYPGPWRPAIHMSRRFSQASLDVLDVRAERLQSISEGDARAEGAIAAIKSLDGRAYDIAEREWCRWSKRLDPSAGVASARGAFAYLWEQIHGKGSWDANPWTWAIGFRRVKG